MSFQHEDVKIFNSNAHVSPGELLKLSDVVMDLKIAHAVLKGGPNLRHDLRVRKTLRFEGIDGKQLVAEHAISSHKPGVTSLRRCAAAASLFVLNELGVDATWSYRPLTEMDHSRLKLGNTPMTNSLSESHGIDKNSIYYYLYNIGLEFNVEKHPLLASALIGWVRKHREQLFGGTRAATSNGQIGDLLQAVVYYEKMARDTGKTNDQIFDDIFHEANELGYFEPLKQMKPRVHPRASPQRSGNFNLYDWL